MTGPLLTDANARANALRRAARAPEMFLQEQAADDLQERLDAVNRTFTKVAIVTDWPQVWADRLPAATIIEPAEVLAFAADDHELVIHSMALHWANDPVGQLVQCQRALRPDGLFLGSMLGGGTLNELRTVLAQAEADVTGGLSPRVLPMGGLRDLGGLLQRAGFNLPVADHLPLRVAYTSFARLVTDLRGMGESNAMTARPKHFGRREIFARAMALYAENFADAEGRLLATFDIVTLTGWAPSADQPKPLRPGSARNRLADALGTVEMPLDPDGK